MAYAAVIFDLDGTLVNTIPLIVESFQHVHREYLGQELAEETCLPWIGRTLPDIYAAWPGREQELTDAFIAYNYDKIATGQRSYDGIHELLAEISRRGLRIGVATSKRTRSAQRSIEVAQLQGFVDALVTLESTAVHKPHPAPLLECARLLGLEPAACIYVGDAVTDIEAAKAAGMASVGVTWGATSAETMRDDGRPDLVAGTARDVLQLLGN